MGLKIKNAVISAFFGALGPFFNKQATLDEDKAIYQFFIERDVRWAIYPFDVICFILMLWVNTIAVKYKMLSYKYDGAFLGTSLIFILGYLFSALFDFIYSGSILSIKQTIGAGMMVLGIILISYQEGKSKIEKHTNSFLEVIGEHQRSYSFNSNLIHGENKLNEPLLIDKSKPPIGFDIPPSIVKSDQKKNQENEKKIKKDCSGQASTKAITVSGKVPSRHKPGEVASLDFIHLRKGFL